MCIGLQIRGNCNPRSIFPVSNTSLMSQDGGTIDTRSKAAWLPQGLLSNVLLHIELELDTAVLGSFQFCLFVTSAGLKLQGANRKARSFHCRLLVADDSG